MDVSNLLLESLTKILKERMTKQEEGPDMQSILNECNIASKGTCQYA